ncbi:hypothetical protein [Nonomuraea rubra]|uniref:Uncharacterized protein n=1 Tax=Nonomuraea rubra TaxID=46180 RepID=A0A7X0TYP2_9ACTN|nr:hypothetical protein [Nonomuraea rubra]MBB6548460.1 hypothetical protein [Nonomuraea rubra]
MSAGLAAASRPPQWGRRDAGVTMTAAFGLLVGLATAPVLATYAGADPRALLLPRPPMRSSPQTRHARLLQPLTAR